MIRVVHPGSGCWLSTPPWSRGQKGTGSRIRIRYTVLNSRKMICDVHHGSRFFPIPDPDPGSKSKKKHRIPDPDTQHWFSSPRDIHGILISFKFICATVQQRFFLLLIVEILLFCNILVRIWYPSRHPYSQRQVAILYARVYHHRCVGFIYCNLSQCHGWRILRVLE